MIKDSKYLKAVQQKVEVAANSEGFSLNDMLKKDRTKKISAVRQAIMYCLRRSLKLSFQEVGDILNKDHTTVIYACKLIDDEFNMYEKFGIEDERIRIVRKISSIFVDENSMEKIQGIIDLYDKYQYQLNLKIDKSKNKLIFDEEEYELVPCEIEQTVFTLKDNQNDYSNVMWKKKDGEWIGNSIKIKNKYYTLTKTNG